MTSITDTAFERKFVRKTPKSDLTRRQEVIPSYLQKVGVCPGCNLPVFSAPGQIFKKIKGLYIHKRCR